MYDDGGGNHDRDQVSYQNVPNSVFGLHNNN